MTKKIVHKIEEGMDPRDVLCTTYQMRNMYKQLHDGFFTDLDVMNYIQHHQIVNRIKSGNRVLDVCCGRGLLLPLLRYLKKDISSYTGVDINPKCVEFKTRRVTDGRALEPNYYPFPVNFINSNVASMSEKCPHPFEVIVYTAAIEHMHHDTGLQSLRECAKLAVPGGILFLTCPNTPENQSGYDTQYKAHVYEWKRSELIAGLKQCGFDIIAEWGLIIDRKSLKSAGEKLGILPIIERLEKFIPKEWLLPVLAPMFPKESKEIGFIAKKL